jgi:hypothetical protein
MKKALLFASIVAIFAACDGGSSEAVETEMVDTTTVETVEADTALVDTATVVE